MNELLQQVDTLKEELRTLRPLSKAELQRLREEFVIETTYNSNMAGIPRGMEQLKQI